MKQTVEIKTGTHSTEIPKGADKLFENLLELAGFKESFRFKIMLGGKRKGSGQCKEIDIGRPDSKGRSVIALAKPGDNGSRFEYYIFRPDGFEGTLEDFFNQLKDAERKFYEERVSKETDPVLEDSKPKDPVMDLPGTEKTGTVLLTAETGKKYRMVSEALDEETIQIILIDIFDSKKDPVLRIDFKNRIRSFNLNCDEDQVILFLSKNEYVRESERINQAKIFFSLGRKGEELLDKKGPHVQPSVSANPAPGEQKNIPPKTVPASDLVELSREFNKLKEVLLAEKEILAVRTKDLTKAEKALIDQQAKVKKMTEIKEEVKKRIEAILLDN